MPLYYLHIVDTQGVVEDLEGAELADLDAAKAEAREGIRGIIAEHLFTGEQLTVQSIRITDPNGAEQACVTVEEALAGLIPALGGRRS
jgi:hypothetical protein